MKNNSSIPPHVPKHMVGMFFIFGAAVVLAVLLFMCWMWGMKKPHAPDVLETKPVVTSTVVEPMPEPVIPKPAVSPEEVVEVPFVLSSLYSPVDTRKMTLEIDWQTPRRESLHRILSGLPLDAVFKDGLPQEGMDLTYRGIVTDGVFKGSKLYFYTFCYEGLGCSEVPGALLVDEVAKKAYLPEQRSFVPEECLVEKSGYGCTGFDRWAKDFVDFATHFTALPNTVIRHPSAPPTRIFAQGGRVLQYSESLSAPAFGSAYYDCDGVTCSDEGYEQIGRDKDGRILWSLSSVGRVGCVYIFGADGRLYAYTTELSAADLRAISWKKGYENNIVYSSSRSWGCGTTGCTDVYPSEIIDQHLEDFTIIGTDASGRSIYAPIKDSDDARSVYDNSYIMDDLGQKISYEAFLKRYKVPVFYWKDALGRYVRYTPADSAPAAECGKPVIYLYPPKTTNVSVKLGSNINVTVSEPTYPTQGWNVVAQPNGDVSYQGKTYGSLFWEGTGVGYDVPSTGFLIKDGQVDQQLTKILAKYGLNEKESAEFREFWVPKMTGAKYYRVSFVETTAWNKAAPLAVSPRPTSVLRIFMDWQKLSKPVEIEEPKIQPFVRDGFTLVEWGGLLRK